MSIKMGNIRNQFDQFKLDTTISVISPKISRTQDLPDIVSHYKTSVQPNANKTLFIAIGLSETISRPLYTVVIPPKEIFCCNE